MFKNKKDLVIYILFFCVLAQFLVNRGLFSKGDEPGRSKYFEFYKLQAQTLSVVGASLEKIVLAPKNREAIISSGKRYSLVLYIGRLGCSKCTHDELKRIQCLYEAVGDCNDNLSVYGVSFDGSKVYMRLVQKKLTISYPLLSEGDQGELHPCVQKLPIVFLVDNLNGAIIHAYSPIENMPEFSDWNLKAIERIVSK